MRRRWSRGRRRAVAVAGVLLAALLGVLAYAALIEPARLVERDYAITPAGWPATCDRLRLDVVSDVHTGSPRNGLDHLDRMVQRLAASDSDVVLMAGDYVILSVFMGTYIPAETIAEHLKPLTARKPVYAVLGNHDWWKDGRDVAARFSAAGVRMVDDSAVPLRVRGCGAWLVGLGDLQEGMPDIAAAFAKVPRGAPVVALTHEPDLWPRFRARAALTIAGHTHGGQLRPWPWPVDRPGQFAPGSHLLAGWIREGDRDLLVSPGIGTSILPMRLGVPPEISRVTVRAVKRER